MKKLFRRIDQSLRDCSGKVSHTKISSYIILSGIYLSSLIYLGIDVVNAISVWTSINGGTYEIPTAHIGIFALLLGHHLALLGIKKNSETKIKVSENASGIIGNTTPDIDDDSETSV